MSFIQNIWCVGTAKFVREISSQIDRIARVRWIADQATLERIFNVADKCDAIVVEHTPAAIDQLMFMKTKMPSARRLVVVDACDLKTLRTYLENAAATEIVYRPIERDGLLKSLGIRAAGSTSRSPTVV